jgi:competence protein ComEC
LQVHFINVGQGDAIVVEFPDGKTMLVDAGPSGNADKLIDYIDNNIFENNEDTFDYMVITHSDTDHIGAMDEILIEYQVNTVYRPHIYATYNNTETFEGTIGMEKDTQTYAKVIEGVQAEPSCNVIFTETDMLISGGSGEATYSLTFLSPIETDYSDPNEYSPIMLLEFKNKRIMLTGDATIDNEEEIINKYDLPKVDLLKLGHHGSSTSTSEALLAEIDIEYAIISVGEDNSYNHPNQETVNRLIYSGVEDHKILATDENGNIIANVNLAGELNLFEDVESLPTYIEWEYVIITIIMLSFGMCFVKGKSYI